jgi:heme/copper-type cytochrome/quinol oxidase subunit 2
MPIKIQAVPKEDFRNWLADAKKKFAHNEKSPDAVHVAASAAADAIRPARASN